MGGFLRQATASQVRAIGPFVDDTDFKTAETGLTIANTDIKLIINGAASANKNSGGGTHRANGVYGLTFDATDTATVGEVFVSVVVSGALSVFDTYYVVEEAVFDALFVASAPGYVTGQKVDVDTIKTNPVVNGGTVTFPTTATLASTTNITAATGCDVTKWNGSNVSVPTNAGVPNVNVKTWNDLATVALPLIPTVAGRTLDCSAGGEAGVDWNNVGTQGATVALTATTIAVTQKVDVDTIKTNPVVNAGTITFPTTATLASTTNITAGTITTATTATNLTNAPTAGDFTAVMKTSIGTAVAASAVASVTAPVSITTNAKKNQALAKFMFLMTDSTNHAPSTGLTVTCTRSIDGAAFGAGTLANVAELSNGIYMVDFGAGDLNGNVIILRASAASSDDAFERIVTFI